MRCVLHQANAGSKQDRAWGWEVFIHENGSSVTQTAKFAEHFPWACILQNFRLRLESNSAKEQEEYKSWNGFSRMGKEKLARIYPLFTLISLTRRVITCVSAFRTVAPKLTSFLWFFFAFFIAILCLAFSRRLVYAKNTELDPEEGSAYGPWQRTGLLGRCDIPVRRDDGVGSSRWVTRKCSLSSSCIRLKEWGQRFFLLEFQKAFWKNIWTLF